MQPRSWKGQILLLIHAVYSLKQPLLVCCNDLKYVSSIEERGGTRVCFTQRYVCAKTLTIYTMRFYICQKRLYSLRERSMNVCSYSAVVTTVLK